MSGKFFSVKEDYPSIIYNALSTDYPDVEIKNIELNKTGWTNIVYEVSTNHGDFYFRFPRDQFWERTIVKDYEFARYIKGKTEFETVNLKLKEDDGRHFSVHKKIEGKPLAIKIKDMSQADKEKVAKQIAKFMYEMHSLKYNPNGIFSVNNIGLKLQDFITELLSLHVADSDKKFWETQNFKIKDEDEVCLVHGDFNSSNILIDDDNNLQAVIDFGFAGFGNKYNDISRVIHRCPELKNEILANYEAFQNREISKDAVEKDIDTWDKIDTGYINYMKSVGIC
jgi:aminoglycoside phosphotransferase (APT) family kinase protein